MRNLAAQFFRRAFTPLLLLISLVGVSAEGYGDVDIEVSSSAIPRGTPTFFTANFKLQGITQKDYDDAAKSLQQLLEKHLQIQIDGHSENADDDFAYILSFATAFRGAKPADAPSDYEDYNVARYTNYVGQVPSDAEMEVQDTSSTGEKTYRAEFNLTFLYDGASDGEDSPKGLMGDGTTITLKVRYDTETTQTITVTQSTAVANAQPGFSLGKVHRGFRFTSDGSAETIPTVDGTEAGTAIKPDLINIFAIKNTGSPQVIAGKVYNKDASAETDFDCTMTFTGDSTCQVTCDNQANVYVNKAELGSEWLQRSLNYGKTTEFNKDLEVGAVYGVFATYEPDGIIWRTGEESANCQAITIKENKTMIEVAAGKSSVLGNPDCFVATAAYGSIMHPHLNELRWFRDHVLMATSLGRQFVTWYYRHGPKAAAVIENDPALRAITRAFLWPVVGVAAASHHQPLLLLAFAILVLGGVVLWRARRRTALA